MKPKTTSQEHINPRPPREEQAWQEIGVTEFRPGVRNFILVFFLLMLATVPLLQFFIPEPNRAHHHGAVEQPVSIPSGTLVTGTVSAVTSPPNKDGVYNDFLMRIHLTKIEGIDSEEVQLVVIAMRDRVILSPAKLRPGDQISAIVRKWDEVDRELSAINTSSFDDERFLLMDSWFAEWIVNQREADNTSDAHFLSEWRGTGIEMTEAWQNRTSLWQGFLGMNGQLANRIAIYETELDDTCALSLMLRPRVQALLTHLGVGNEEAYLGKNGWLFFKPGVVSITGPAFLDPNTLRRRVRYSDSFSDPIQPDPRLAILDFHRQLKSRGIKLILMPTPVKPSVHAEQFGSGSTLVRNPSYPELLEDLTHAGVHVYDPSRILMEQKQHSPQYLRTDTHWTPTAMMAVARDLASSLKAELPAPTPHHWTLKAETFSQLGDIGAMLELPEDQRVIKPETLTIQSVRDPKGKGWRADPKQM